METLSQPPEKATFSSSPAFGTPLHPLPPTQPQRPPPPPLPAFKPTIQTILPILLPPPTLRPLAFRTFTKKHNLTLNASALQALATFIGRHCGTGWREEGTGEKVVDEVAKLWKAESGPVIVEDGERLRGILKTLEGGMSGGRVGLVKKGNSSNLSRQSSGFAFGNDDSAVELLDAPARPSLDGRHSSFGISKLQVESADSDEDELEEEGEEEEGTTKDPRAWLKVISAFDQPRHTYDTDKKHFLPLTTKPSPFPSPTHKTTLFKQRYNLIHQRLLRNEAFQAPSFSTSTVSRKERGGQQFYKLTPIANLLGRGGTSHLLLGLLVIAPTGTLALHDPSGSIALDLAHAVPLQGGEVNSFFCPGMIVLVDGVYEEDYSGAGSSGLGNTGGVGGTIGGRFLGFSIGGPPVEKRHVSLGIDLGKGEVGGGFGWTDFLGLGSERAVGGRMRRLERRVFGLPRAQEGLGEERRRRRRRRKMVVLGEVILDHPPTLSALRKVLALYAAQPEPPMTFLLTGNFTSQPAMAGAGAGSIEYKELFNALAALLSDFPSLLRSSTWVFVPGDSDPWNSAFSAGASTMVPRGAVPEVFTSRIKRAFATAKAEAGAKKDGGVDGEAIWTSNPARLSLFGPRHEVVVFRDDVSGRLTRSAIGIGQATHRSDGGAGTQQLNGEASERDSGDDVVMSGAMPTTEQPDPEEVAAAIPPNPPATTTTTSTTSTSSDDPATIHAKKLTLTLLPQSTLSPFPLPVRPVHWDYALSSLSLYPLPHTLILADAEAEPFALTFEGCHVLNPGRLVQGEGRQGRVRWAEYDWLSGRGRVREEVVGVRLG